jgi:hypothetical protein
MRAKTSVALALVSLLLPAFGPGSSHFTEKQLEALAKQVGKTYWIVAGEGKPPIFFSAPSPSASPFPVGVKESFQITALLGGSTPKPYYGVNFASGKEGYVSVESFLEELNSTFVAQDPDKGQKRKSAKEASEESRREAWIRAQPWPAHVKEAALKRQAILGMNMSETRAALGKPSRVVKVKHGNPLLGEQEQWIYEGGPVLTFTNRVLSRMQPMEATAE